MGNVPLNGLSQRECLVATPSFFAEHHARGDVGVASLPLPQATQAAEQRSGPFARKAIAVVVDNDARYPACQIVEGEFDIDRRRVRVEPIPDEIRQCRDRLSLDVTRDEALEDCNRNVFDLRLSTRSRATMPPRCWSHADILSRRSEFRSARFDHLLSDSSERKLSAPARLEPASRQRPDMLVRLLGL